MAVLKLYSNELYFVFELWNASDEWDNLVQMLLLTKESIDYMDFLHSLTILVLVLNVRCKIC